MKKNITIIALLALALLLTACAGSASEAVTSSAYIPETAEQIRSERDDGFTETLYRDEDGARYTLYTDRSDNVRVLKFDSLQRSSAGEVVLTADEAFAVVTGVYPNATLVYSDQERDDGFYEWNVIFSDDEILGEYELDAATGAVIDYTLFYSVPADFNPASIITSNYAGAEITEMNLDEDDGRLQVDGQARLNGRSYDFTIDVDSGNITEWEWDD